MATKKELLEQLAERGIEADESATKAELEALLAENGGAGEGAGEEEVAGGLLAVTLAGNCMYGGVSYKSGERVTIKASERDAFIKAGLIASEAAADSAGTSEESNEDEDSADSDE